MAECAADERGSIYIEALIALAILAIALVPIIGAFALSPAAQQESGEYLAALNLAREELEGLHARGPETAGAGYQRSVSLNGVTYQVNLQVEPYPDPGEGGSGGGGGSPPEPKLSDFLYNATVTVSWTDRKGAGRRVTLATAVARRS